MRPARDLETLHTLDVGAMQIGDAIVIVDDERANHRRAMTFVGMRTVKSAPPSLTTVTSPPFLRAICRTRARPKPRRLCPGPDLVLKPSWKICPSVSTGTP